MSHTPWYAKVISMFLMQEESTNTPRSSIHVLVVTPTSKVHSPVSQVQLNISYCMSKIYTNIATLKVHYTYLTVTNKYVYLRMGCSYNSIDVKQLASNIMDSYSNGMFNQDKYLSVSLPLNSTRAIESPSSSILASMSSVLSVCSPCSVLLCIIRLIQLFVIVQTICPPTN